MGGPHAKSMTQNQQDCWRGSTPSIEKLTLPPAQRILEHNRKPICPLLPPTREVPSTISKRKGAIETASQIYAIPRHPPLEQATTGNSSKFDFIRKNTPAKQEWMIKVAFWLEDLELGSFGPPWCPLEHSSENNVRLGYATSGSGRWFLSV